MTGRYRGDCHVHSVHSDGELTPARLAADARAAGLDFLATTDHNTAAAHHSWPGEPLVILGEEVTTRNGHWLALGLAAGQVIDWQHDARDVDRHLVEVRRRGGLCVAAHPHAPYETGTFRYPLDGFDLVEVWNGPWTSDRPWQADNEAALADWSASLVHDVRAGRWRPAIGNSDTHLAGQLGIPHTIVHAEALTVDALLTGLRAGRSVLVASTAIDLSVTATSGSQRASVGERLAADDVVVRVAVVGVPDGIVGFHTELGEVARMPVSANAEVEWRGAAEFVRVEVRQPDGSVAALSNPVILR